MGDQRAGSGSGWWTLRSVGSRVRSVVAVLGVLGAVAVGAGAAVLAISVSVSVRTVGAVVLAAVGVGLVVVATVLIVDDRWHAPLESLPRRGQTSLLWGAGVLTVAVALLSTALASPAVTVAVALLSAVASVPVYHALAWRAVRRRRAPGAVREMAKGGIATAVPAAGLIGADIAGAPVPNVVPGLGFLLGWSLWVGLASLWRVDTPSRVRLRQTARVEPWPVAVVGTLPVGASVGTLVLAADATVLGSLTAGILAWTASTGAALWWLVRQRTRATSDGLALADCTERGDAGRRLTVENVGSTPVDLSAARVEDARGDHYAFDGETLVPVGQDRTVRVPDRFSLSTEDTSIQLPLGYTLGHDRTVPVVYDVGGTGHTLRRQDDRSDAGAPPPVKRDEI